MQAPSENKENLCVNLFGAEKRKAYKRKFSDLRATTHADR